MKKKAVLFISTGYGSSPALSGGEIRLYNLMRRKPGSWDASFLTTTAGAFSLNANFHKTFFKEIITVNYYLFFRKQFSGFQRFLGYFISAADSVKKISKKKFDMLYTSTDFFCDVYPAYDYKKKYPGVKWACMIHHKYLSPFKRPGNFFVNTLLYLLQQFSFKLIAKRSDIIFVLDTDAGDMIAENIRKFGYNGRIVKVKNGINKEPKHAFVKDKKLCIYVGGLRASKGLYDIVPVWKKVHAENNSLKLAVIGKGSEKDAKYLQKEIDRYSLGTSIIQAGYVDPKKLKQYLRGAFMLFLPSREEGWGISILEALQFGCHAVVYDLPAFKVFEKEIVRIKRYDHAAYADKIVELFKSGRLKTINAAFIRKFYWDDIAAKEIDLLDKSLI